MACNSHEIIFYCLDHPPQASCARNPIFPTTAKADAAEVDEGVPGESIPAGVGEPATSVLKQMLGAYERSGALCNSTCHLS